MIEAKEEFSSLIPLLAPDEYKQLEANCISEGIREPLIVWDGVIIDGHNRYKIAQEHSLDYKTINKEFESQEAAKEWMILNQFGRRNLSAYQRSVLALQLEDVFRAKARERQKGGQGGSLLPKKSAEAKGETREELAKVASVSHDTIAKVKKLQEKAPQEIKDKLATGEMSINQAYQEVKREEKKQQQEIIFAEIEKDNAQNFKGLYDVIVIDPPWPMEKIERDVAPMQIGFDYPTMPIDEIKNMEIPAKDNCHVFMWTTQKYLPDSFEIFRAWSVKYIFNMVWHKNGGFQPFNLPQYNCEFIMYGRIGTPKFKETSNFFTCFDAKRTGHSKKPDEFYELVDRVTVGKRLDMFNRRAIKGFDLWGNQS